MAKKTDPFADFAEKMLSGPKVSEASVEPVVEEKEDTAGAVAAQPEADSPTGELPGRREKLSEDYLRTTYYIRKDLLSKLRVAGFNSETSAKALVNMALDEFFQNHPEMLK